MVVDDAPSRRAGEDAEAYDYMWRQTCVYHFRSIAGYQQRSVRCFYMSRTYAHRRTVMGWTTLERPKSMIATRALVDEFASMERVPSERPLSERRVALYQRILDRGEFRTVTWAAAICDENNTTYRINGQHTCVLLQRQPTLPEKFDIIVERYRVSDMTELMRLYNTFDSSMASRSVNDINAAFASAIPELAGIGPRILSLAVTALADQKWSDAQRVPAAERAEELMDNADFVVWLDKLLPGRSSSSIDVRASPHSIKVRVAALRRSPVVSAMLATYRKAPRLARDFWIAVRDESAPTTVDATRTLGYFLRGAVVGSNRAARGTTHRIVGHREMYAKCITAWNAWRKGESTHLRYYPAAALPEPSK